MPLALSPRSHTRPTLSLDGTWKFSFDGGAPVAGAEIIVPGIWQARFPALRNARGTGTYSTTVTVPPYWAGKKVFVVFGGVFHHASVRVDGRLVASHANGWTPFEVDVSDAGSSFRLDVTATLPDDHDYEGGGFSPLLHGKQDWYGLQGGIWKSVRLEARDPLHATSLAVRTSTDLTRHSAFVSGELSADEPATLRVRLHDGERTLNEFSQVVARRFDVGLTIDHGIELWSPDHPKLYCLDIQLGDDLVTREVGFRLFESRSGRLWLNGSPFYMFGALDQDWYPETEARAPDDSFLEQRFRNAKALGLNTLRCHVKIPDPAYFELADRLGLVVWLDMPYPETFSAETRLQLMETFEATAAAEGHHPSICVWTIANEGWGIELDDNPDDRAWLISAFDRLKASVPHGLVVDNSPCAPRNYHLKTDIEDFHWYSSWPSQNAAFEATTRAFADRAEWTFSPHGDACRTGDEALVCSEFGVWGLPHPRGLLDPSGGEPWWFETGHDWNNGAAYPHGMQARFDEVGLHRHFGHLDDYVEAAQDMQFRSLKYQIETLRYHASISGYVITELNDAHWEANGLMDERNTLRSFAPQLEALQRASLVIARPPFTSLASEGSIDIPLRLASRAGTCGPTRLRWSFGSASGELEAGASASGSAEAVLSLEVPAAKAIRTIDLRLEAVDSSGGVEGRNIYQFCLVPRHADLTALTPADDRAGALLDEIAYPTASDGTLLATQLTSAVREHLLAGRKVLLIANDADALQDPDRKLPAADPFNFPKMLLQQRDGTPWDGRWMGAFCWRRVDGPWSRFPNGPMLDEHWTGLLPRYVLTGFRSTAYAGLVDAGITVGWLHKSAAFTKRSFLGKAWLTVTTFDLLSEAGRRNPLAPQLLDALAQS